MTPFQQRQIAIFLVLISTGCGSLSTLPPGSQYRLSHSSRYERTSCNSIPRIYSGVCLDACMAFMGPPPMPQETYDERILYGYLADMALSLVIDTLALPYTIPSQLKSGNLYLKRRIKY